MSGEQQAPDRSLSVEDENERLMRFVEWVDGWVSHPVGSYSVYALDGLFGMTRDRIHEIYKRRNEQRNG